VRVVLRALNEGRPVRMLLGTLEQAGPFAAKIEAYRKEIAGYGIEVVAGAAPSASGPLSGQGAPPPPHTHVSGSGNSGAHHHHPNSPCQLKAVGECAGLGHCSHHLPERVGIILEHGADRLSTAPGGAPVASDMARYIDHTLLKPDATREEVVKLCEEARQHKFVSVCVNPGFVRLAADALAGSTVKVCTVVGFPLGATTTVSKALETRDAIANGADEIDMVINVGALKAHNDDLVRRDIEAVVEAASGRIVKVILETALLNDEEKVRACKLCQQAGADFVKTSTGFGPGGATAHDIALMRQTVGRYMGVKASGGIRDLAVAQEMIKAGATRIGASASVKIVKGEVTPDSAKGKQAY
jgi:deoxyribose-phosphate aldolase